MTRRSRRLVALTLGAGLALLGPGCSDINDIGDGVVALEVTAPIPAEVERGDTLQLSGRALDRNGETVADAVLSWRTVDASITVIAETGQVIGVTPNAVGRVQLVSGTLVSDPVSVSVRPRVDTVVVPGPSELTVAAGVATSDPLVARLESFGAQGIAPGPLNGRPIIFEIVEPAFASPAERTVELPGGVLIDTVLTGANGAPSPPITVSRVTGTTAPASAIVEVRAFRIGGGIVPGSGQRFTIHFQ